MTFHLHPNHQRSGQPHLFFLGTCSIFTDPLPYQPINQFFPTQAGWVIPTGDMTTIKQSIKILVIPSWNKCQLEDSAIHGDATTRKSNEI
jgi:hypothetical protein